MFERFFCVGLPAGVLGIAQTCQTKKPPHPPTPWTSLLMPWCQGPELAPNAPCERCFHGCQHKRHPTSNWISTFGTQGHFIDVQSGVLAWSCRHHHGIPWVLL